MPIWSLWAGPVSQCFMDLNFSWWVVYDGEIVFWVHCDGKFARLLFKCLKVQFVPCSTISCSSHMEMYVNAKWHIFVHWAEATSLLLAPPHNTTTTVISLVTTVPPRRQRECCTVFLPVLFLCSCWPACKTHLFIKTLFIPTIENANLNSFRF